MSNMKKFGRGYVLDFTALMNEVRSPNQKPPDDITGSTSSAPTTPAYPATSFDVSDSSGQSPTNSGDRDFGFGENDNASGADATPSPTDDDLSEASQGMMRRPARMSVSRTGRLKNRDRQRISVLETSGFYGAKPDAPPPLPARGKNAGHHPTVRDASGRKASDGALSNETLADFDREIAALDNGIPAQLVKADCFSF